MGWTYNALAVRCNLLVPVSLAILLLLDLLVLDALGLVGTAFFVCFHNRQRAVELLVSESSNWCGDWLHFASRIAIGAIASMVGAEGARSTTPKGRGGDIRKALSFPAYRALAVWKERVWTGAAKTARRAAKERRVKDDIVVVV